MKNSLLLLFFPVLLFSQNTKKAQKYYSKAVEFFEVGNDKKARDFLQYSISQDENYLSPYLLLGQIEEESGNIELAIKNYLLGLSDNKLSNAWGYWKLGMLYMQIPNYTEATRVFHHFLSFKDQNANRVESAKRQLKNCDFSIKSLANPQSFKFENMGEGVNSQWEEYLPSISADGKLFVITRRGPYQNGIVSEDFFQSEYKDGRWGMAQNMGPSINTKGNEGAQCLAPNGKVLFFTACDRKDGLGRCDLYFSVKKHGQWVEARNLGPTINTKYWESQPTISPDGRELYFLSNRPGGFGDMDIWKSFLTEKGTFSSPVNLGSTINTKFDEMSPFIHMDNKSLYFASKGHPGLGDFDLFLSKREHPLDEWKKPINLGYPINTHGIENSLIVASDGKTAYFASDKSGYGKEDIFWFYLPEDIQSQKVAFLNTKVYDSETKIPMKSSIEIIDLSNGKVMISSFTYTKSGEFFTCLPANTDYAVNISKDSYLFHSENFSLNEQSALQALELDIPLQRLNVGSKIVLNNIFFDTDAYTFKKKSKVELNTLLNFMQNNAKLNIEIEGHTDNMGSKSHNLKLSENRARSVYNFLVTNGIDSNRMSYRGFGSSQPIATNSTDEGRASNRRTAFRVK